MDGNKIHIALHILTFISLKPCSGIYLMFQTPRGRLGVWRFETSEVVEFCQAVSSGKKLVAVSLTGPPNDFTRFY